MPEDALPEDGKEWFEKEPVNENGRNRYALAKEEARFTLYWENPGRAKVYGRLKAENRGH